jgi:PEP-CTERM motif
MNLRSNEYRSFKEFRSVGEGGFMIASVRTNLLCALTFIACLPSLAATINPGNILISNHGGNNVQLLDPVTSAVSSLVTLSGTPIGLAFDVTGKLYINVGAGIQRYDPATNTLNASFYTGVGQREGLTFDPTTSHLFSVSFGSNRIEEVDLAGNLVRTITIPGSSQVLGISARGGNLIVSDFGNGNVYKGTTSGSSFSLIGNVDPGATYAPDIDASGNVFVNDFNRGLTVEFASLGGGLYGPKTTFISGLNSPANGLSIGDDGSFTISEFGANAISVWNSGGTLRQRFTGISAPDELVVFAPVRSGGGDAPEPSTFALFGLAVAVFTGRLRYHKRQR